MKLREKLFITAAWLTVLLFYCAGCTGSATVNFISLHPTEIDPPSTEVHRYDAHEAYWFVDGDGNLKICFHATKSWGLSAMQLDTAIVPGGPPAGSGRDYEIKGSAARAVIKGFLTHIEYKFYNGVASVIVDDERHIHGSFRLWMRSNDAPTIWSFIPRTHASILCFGTFKAIKNEKAAKEILIKCGMNPFWWNAPTSAPTTQPAVLGPYHSDSIACAP